MIPRHYLELFEPLERVDTMLELGNKRGTGGPGDTYKLELEARGIHHTSVDWNGEDGALPLDLRKPLELGVFDMVTNVGTSEHVDDQEPVWRNIVEAARLFVVCITPAPGDWPGHGLFYPTEGFYRELARLNGFTIPRLYRAGPEGRRFVYARLERARFDDDVAFLMPAADLLSPAPPRRKSR